MLDVANNLRDMINNKTILSASNTLGWAARQEDVRNKLSKKMKSKSYEANRQGQVMWEEINLIKSKFNSKVEALKNKYERKYDHALDDGKCGESLFA